MAKIVYRLDKTGEIASSIISFSKKQFANLNLAKNKQAVVFALNGNLGAGKTTLVQKIAEKLGIKENVTSPTFPIIKSYEIKDFIFSNLIHIDAYRIEDVSEVGSLRLVDYLKNPNNLVFIEWPEKVPNILPGSTIYINIDSFDHESRVIESNFL